MFAYCGNNPVNRTDNLGEDWLHWAVAAAIVVAAAAAVVITAGAGITGAVVAITSVANGVAASTTGATIAAGVFIGSSTAFVASAYAASLESDSAAEFAEYGESAMYSTGAGGFWGGVAGYSMARSQTKPQCFVAGTLIHTSNGFKTIESIQAGDLVWAWDEKTGEVALKEVVETYVNETNELVHVFVNGEEIITTPAHPFYTTENGWTNAEDLCAGEVIILVNGERSIVNKVHYEILKEPVTVYNFNVEAYHTYYVSTSGILVHNSCNGKRRTEDQQALADLANEVKRDADRGKFITYEEAKLLDAWAQEYNVPQHHTALYGSGEHWMTGWDHTHIYNIHVPFK